MDYRQNVEIQVKAGKRAFSMGDVRLYTSKKSASLTNFNVVYTHLPHQGNQLTLKWVDTSKTRRESIPDGSVHGRTRAREHGPQRCIAPYIHISPFEATNLPSSAVPKNRQYPHQKPQEIYQRYSQGRYVSHRRRA